MQDAVDIKPPFALEAARWSGQDPIRANLRMSSQASCLPSYHVDLPNRHRCNQAILSPAHRKPVILYATKHAASSGNLDPRQHSRSHGWAKCSQGCECTHSTDKIVPNSLYWCPRGDSLPSCSEAQGRCVPCKKHGVGSSFLAPFAFKEGLGACAGFPELQVILSRPYSNFETMDFGDLRSNLWPLPRSNVAGWQLHRFLPTAFYAYTHFFFSILFFGIAEFFVLLVLRFPTNTRPSTFSIRLGSCGDGSLFVPLQRRTFALRRAFSTCTHVSNSSIPSRQASLPFTRVSRPFDRCFVQHPSLFLPNQARARRQARLTSSNPTSSGNSSSLLFSWPSCTTSLLSSSCTTFASFASVLEYLFRRVDTILAASKSTNDAPVQAKVATQRMRGWRRKCRTMPRNGANIRSIRWMRRTKVRTQEGVPTNSAMEEMQRTPSARVDVAKK